MKYTIVKRPKMIFFIFMYAILLSSSASSSTPYVIKVDKSDSTLLVETNRGETIKTFSVATGRGGIGDKKKIGDKKTPVGTYYVTGFNEKSKFDYFIRINYPNLKDAYYGYKSRKINRDEFKNIFNAIRNGKQPPQNTKLGGAIGIHGIGNETRKKLLIHRNIDWTEGCVALRNFEVRELKPFVSIGTKVIISD